MTDELEIQMRDPNTDMPYTVRFKGHWLIAPGLVQRTDDERFDGGTCWVIARTEHDRLAVYTWHINERFAPTFATYDTLDEAAGEVPSDVLAMAGTAMDVGFAQVLDI